jgi:hypothetical protein
MCTSSALLTEVVFELEHSSTISVSSSFASQVSQMLSHSGLLLIMYLLIKATITPAPKGSKIDGITKATENYSVILVPSVLS